MNFKFNTRKIVSFLLILTMMISTLAFNVMASATFKFGSSETALSAMVRIVPYRILFVIPLVNHKMLAYVQ